MTYLLRFHSLVLLEFSDIDILKDQHFHSLLSWYKEALEPLAGVMDFKAFEQFKVHRAEAAIKAMEEK